MTTAPHSTQLQPRQPLSAFRLCQPCSHLPGAELCPPPSPPAKDMLTSFELVDVTLFVSEVFTDVIK